MKRVLIHEDKNLLDEISSDLKQYQPLLEEVRVNYLALELGNFTNDILKEITQSGIKRIEDNFIENLDKQIDKLEVTNSVLRENLLNGSKPMFQSFSNSVAELKRFKPDTFSRTTPLRLKFISFKDDEFHLSESDKKEILEVDCRIYLENEKELELHKDLVNFIEAYENVSDNLKGLEFLSNYRTGEEMSAIRNTFLSFSGGKYSIKPGSIKFASNYKENSLKYS